MLMRSLLLGTALTIAVAGSSLAQNTAPGATPGTTTRPAAPATQPPAATPPAATQVTPARMEGSHLIGLTVRNGANESIGAIDDVLVDADGRVRQVIVSVGGFLGIGEHKVAIGWDQLRFDATRDVAVVSYTKEQLQAMPQYRAQR